MKWFIAKKHLVCLIGLLVAAILLMLLSGCGWGREANQRPACPGAGSTLVAIGQWTVVVGSAAIGAGILATVASFFPWTAFLQVFRPIFAEIIALGVTAVLLGSAAIWLGTHAWLMAIVVLLVAAGLVFRYRNRIGRFLGLPRKSPAAKVVHV